MDEKIQICELKIDSEDYLISNQTVFIGLNGFSIYNNRYDDHSV